ncbi:MAG: alpha/beta hydrolase [Chloroflexota bacterium]|jgi:pimeloyl-ACP methyl ester carboxylesterase
MELKTVDLAVETHGEGVPLVLLHGFPLNRSIWKPIIPLLKEKARLILPDLRGYGESPKDIEEYSMRLLAADVVALLNRLQVDKVVLAGHSMGGYVALEFAHAYPNRLSGLALIASQADADSPERRQARLITAREVRRKGIKYIADGMPSKLTHDESIQQELKRIISSNPVRVIEAALKAMADRRDANPWLPGIKVPLVAVAGGKDQLIPVEKVTTLSKLAAKGWSVEIPEAGHMPMMEAPDQVGDALTQLICASNGC